jgi:SAM-dependent methyltransferase
MTDWDRRYREGEYANEPPHPLVVTFASKFPVPGQALDVACGTGRHALWLAQGGWDVTAVDNSRAGLEILAQRAEDKRIRIRTIVADLEAKEFAIETAVYDLIVVCNYLQRDLFPAIREGVRPGGMVIAVIAMVDEDPEVKPMNPAFLLNPGELRAEFKGWDLLHDVEGKSEASPHARKTAQLAARKRRL